MKQTAVEWLEEQIKESFNIEGKLSVNNILMFFNEAKEIEKQQIIDAYETGDKYKLEVPGKQYYNEQFNK